MVSKSQQKLKNIPSVNALLERDDIRKLIPRWSFGYVSFETKKQVDLARQRLQKAGHSETADKIASRIIEAFEAKEKSLIKPVVNATGVALHTNLGRAPLQMDLLKVVFDNCSNYCNLEFDLVEGKRSKRGALAGEMAAVLAGAEAGLVVNNNAAAVLLIVNCFAANKEVVVSRGELIQIGGGFRIPEMITASGAIIREVGTTNRTILSDYSKRIGKNTGLILKVHKSNFDIRGFTEEVSPSDLASLAHKKRLPILYDLGSGMIDDFGIAEFEVEPTVASAVRSKADMVCFSGDKLLGGPQAGVIVGKKSRLSALRSHPLYRPLRPDKFTLSTMEQTLLAYLARPAQIKLRNIFRQGLQHLQKRAEKICQAVGGDYVVPVKLKATAGGGSTPNIGYPSYGIAIEKNVELIEMKLRKFDPPIISRRSREKTLLDLSTVFEAQDDIIIRALIACLS